MSTARAVLLTACAVVFAGSGCTIERRRDTERAPVIALQHDTAAAEFGAIDVLYLGGSTLDALERAAPSLEQWHTVLRVQTASAQPGDSAALPLLGSYSVEGDRLRFRPRFPPVAGQPYRVRFDGAALQPLTSGSVAPVSGAVIDTIVLIPRAEAAPTTSVLQLFPTAERLPLNLLRIYLHFSAPMSVGEAYRRVRVVDESGRTVEDAFLVVAGEAELWDPARRRLTLLFDPGRIKRGLRPHEEAGLPLREGRTFSIVVDSSWQDAYGRPLARGFKKTFTVGPADRTMPRTEDWQVGAPASGSRANLTLTFPEPLDRALLERLITVKRANGRVLAGTIAVDGQETVWRFSPAEPWQEGAHELEVDTDLEDLAGNNLRDLFDVDRTAPASGRQTARHITIPFVVR